MDIEELSEILANTICEEFGELNGARNIKNAILLRDTGNGYEVKIDQDLLCRNARDGRNIKKVVERCISSSINRWATENGVETEDEY